MESKKIKLFMISSLLIIFLIGFVYSQKQEEKKSGIEVTILTDWIHDEKPKLPEGIDTHVWLNHYKEVHGCTIFIFNLESGEKGEKIDKNSIGIGVAGQPITKYHGNDILMIGCLSANEGKTLLLAFEGLAEHFSFRYDEGDTERVVIENPIEKSYISIELGPDDTKYSLYKPFIM